MLEVKRPQSQKSIIRASDTEGLIDTHAVDGDATARVEGLFLLLLGVYRQQPPHMLDGHLSIVHFKDVACFAACISGEDMS